MAAAGDSSLVDSGAAPVTPRELAAAGLVAALALVVRALRWSGTVLMFNDGPTFLALAGHMAEGRWGDALAHDYHPLYPFVVMMGQLALGDAERAAAWISIAGGTLAVAALWVFLRGAFGPRPALLGALLLAVQPRAIDFSSDVQSDGLYLGLFLAGVAWLWWGWRAARPAWAFLAGLVSGLAYLARPEGLGVVLVGGLLAAASLLRGRWRLLPATGWAASLAAGALLVTLPYLAVLRVEHGAWTFTQKKSVTHLLALEEEGAEGTAPAATPEAGAAPAPQPEEVPVLLEPTGPLRAAGYVLDAAANAVRPWFAPLIVFGLWLRRGRPGPAGGFVLAFVGLYTAVCMAQAFRYGYLDTRHALPPLTLAFGYAGIAMPALGALLLRPFTRAPDPRIAVAVVVLAVAAAGLGQALKPEKADRRAERAAADWLAAQALPPGAVAAAKGRLAYYAGRAHVPLYGAPSPGLLPWLRERGARYVILEDEKLDEFPELRDAARSGGLARLHRAEVRGEVTTVYALRDANAAVAGPGAP